MSDKNEQPSILSQLIPAWIGVAGLIALLCLGAILVDLLINPFSNDGEATDETRTEAVNEPAEESTEGVEGAVNAEGSDQATEDINDEIDAPAESEVTGAQNGSTTAVVTNVLTASIQVASNELPEESDTSEPTPEPIVQFEQEEYSVSEGEEEVSITIEVVGTVTVSPTNPAQVKIRINEGQDQDLFTEPLPIEGPLLTHIVRFENNDIPESNREWTLQLVEPEYAKLGDRQEATLTILDDDAMLGFAEAGPKETEEERRQVMIEVELQGQSREEITVDYAGSGASSAREGKDYSFEESRQTLIFSPGEHSKEFILNIIDNNDEGDKNIILILSNPVGAEINSDRSRLEVIILDEDASD